jgi:glutathione peroxidase-family protein
VTPSWNFFKYLVDHNGDIIQVQCLHQPSTGQAWGPQTAVEDIFESVEAAVQDAELVVQVESPLAGNIDLHDEL